FAAEAFVSLDMAAEGIDYFRREAGEAAADRDRLSAAVVLCQLLLVADRKAEYAEEVVDRLLPLAGRVLPGAGPDRGAVGGAVALTVLPLAAGEFTVALPEALVRRVGEAIAARPRGDDTADFAC